MNAAITAGSLACIALECAILTRILWAGVALPAFAAFLAADIIFSASMMALQCAGAGWMTPRYLHWYGVAVPCVLALLVASTVEAVGPVPRVAACGLVLLVIAAMVATPAPVETRCAILGACAAALIVSITEGPRSTHAAMLLAFVLAAVVESLAICLGEAGTLRPAAFLVGGQIVPLVGWAVWVNEMRPRSLLSA